jgi:hypothetical protein
MRVGGDTVARPALGGERERLLGRFLGEVEVADVADQAGEDAAPLLPKDPFEDSLALHDRADLDGAAPAHLRNALGKLDCRVEIIGLVDEVAAERFLHGGERPVGG